MTPIITIPRLEISARKPAGSLAADPYAQFVLETASEIVVDRSGHPEWEEDDFDGTIPRAARRIALAVATRAFLNPELEKSWHTGPLGATNADEWAAGFALTEYELEELEDLQGGGQGSTSGLWAQPIGGLPDVGDTTIYAKDPWWPTSTPIAYQDEGDVGTIYEDI